MLARTRLPSGIDCIKRVSCFFTCFGKLKTVADVEHRIPRSSEAAGKCTSDVALIHLHCSSVRSTHPFSIHGNAICGWNCPHLQFSNKKRTPFSIPNIHVALQGQSLCVNCRNGATSRIAPPASAPSRSIRAVLSHRQLNTPTVQQVGQC